MLYVTRNKLTNAPPLPEKYYKKINKTHNVRKESFYKNKQKDKVSNNTMNLTYEIVVKVFSFYLALLVFSLL